MDNKVFCKELEVAYQKLNDIESCCTTLDSKVSMLQLDIESLRVLVDN